MVKIVMKAKSLAEQQGKNRKLIGFPYYFKMLSDLCFETLWKPSRKSPKDRYLIMAGELARNPLDELHNVNHEDIPFQLIDV